MSREIIDLHTGIVALRTQLRAIGLNGIVRPSMKSGGRSTAPPSLPSNEEALQLRQRFDRIVATMSRLPSLIEEPAPNAELRSLQFEVEASKPLADRLLLLGQFTHSISQCDSALSDLLEHLDSFPEPPSETISSHETDLSLTPEQQLSSRVGFTGSEIDSMKRAAEDIVDDPRVSVEKERMEQTWGELWDMCMEKMNNSQTRPPSAETARKSQDTIRSLEIPPIHSKPGTLSKRPRASSNLSIGLGVPSTVAKARLSGLGAPLPSSRSASRISNRSVSGPTNMSTSKSGSSLFQTTFASRQRTNSNSSMASSTPTPKRDPPGASRPRASVGQLNLASPTISEFSNHTHPTHQARPSTWSRASRSSLSGNPRTLKESFSTSRAGSPATRAGTPSSRNVKVRKTYVANQKHKVDVAVAEVVNTLDVHVNVEPVSWKDQSGKYWIGDTDPKLCFCRILRSHTVMVRVGGGWMELSKYVIATLKWNRPFNSRCCLTDQVH